MGQLKSKSKKCGFEYKIENFKTFIKCKFKMFSVGLVGDKILYVKEY